jgi:hypothetical protein
MSLTKEDVAVIIRKEVGEILDERFEKFDAEKLAPMRVDIQFIKSDINVLQRDVKYVRSDLVGLREEIDKVKHVVSH